MKAKLIAVVVVVALVAAVASFFVFFDEPTGDEIGERMEGSYAEVDDYEGTMSVQYTQVTDRGELVDDEELRQQAEALAAESDMTVEEAEETIVENLPDEGMVETGNYTTVAEVSFTKPDRYRYDYVETPPRNPMEVTTTEDNVAMMHLQGYEPYEVHVSDADAGVVGIRMVDYVPTITDDYGIEVNETETTDETYVLDLTPVAEFDGALDRVEVDRETYLPVRVERTQESGRSLIETTVEYDYEYDVGVSDGVFDVDTESIAEQEPPFEAPGEEEHHHAAEVLEDVEEPDAPDRFTFDTVEEAEEQFGFDIPDNEIPELDYDRTAVRGRTVHNNSSVTMTYSGDQGNLMVYHTIDRGSRFGSWHGDDHEAFTLEEVEIGDRMGELHYYEVGDELEEVDVEVSRRVVRFNCDEMLIEVYSGSLSNDELMEAADEIRC